MIKSEPNNQQQTGPQEDNNMVKSKKIRRSGRIKRSRSPTKLGESERPHGPHGSSDTYLNLDDKQHSNQQEHNNRHQNTSNKTFPQEESKATKKTKKINTKRNKIQRLTTIYLGYPSGGE